MERTRVLLRPRGPAAAIAGREHRGFTNGDRNRTAAGVPRHAAHTGHAGRGVKQVVARRGESVVVDQPAPSPAPGRLLVATAASVISSGTERSVVAAGVNSSLPVRAIRNP